MNELTLTLIRVAFLAILWLFVLAAIGVVRTDLSGNSAGRSRAMRKQPQAPRTARAAKPGEAAAVPARAAPCARRDGRFPEGNDH